MSQPDSPVQRAQHHPRDVVERGAVRVGLADQTQALDPGGEKARQCADVGGPHDLAARLGAAQRVAKRGLDPLQAAANAGGRFAIVASELRSTVADEAAAAAGAGDDVVDEAGDEPGDRLADRYWARQRLIEPRCRSLVVTGERV